VQLSCVSSLRLETADDAPVPSTAQFGLSIAFPGHSPRVRTFVFGTKPLPPYVRDPRSATPLPCISVCFHMTRRLFLVHRIRCAPEQSHLVILLLIACVSPCCIYAKLRGTIPPSRLRTPARSHASVPASVPALPLRLASSLQLMPQLLGRRVGAVRRRAKPAVRGPSRRCEPRERAGKRARCSDTKSLWTPSRQARWSVTCLRCGDFLRCAGYLGSVVLMVLL
jgi:hypothetical protein